MIDSPKTFWLFGAGASHHYDMNTRGVPLPLANGFFEAFNQLPTSSGFNAHVGPMISYLKEYRGVPPDKVPEWTENIETFMTSLESELLEIKRKGRKRSKEDTSKSLSLAMALNNMTFILANVINEAQNGPAESLYSYLLHFCGPNDLFATFNWDTVLDRSLAATGGWSPNNGYSLSFSSTLDGTWRRQATGRTSYKTTWKLLKLHGSTNWLVPYTYVDLRTLEFLHTVPKSDRIFLYWQSILPFKTHNSRWRGGYVPTCYGYYPPHIPGAAFPKKHLAAKPGHVWLRINQRGVFSPFGEPNPNGAPSSPLLITPVRQKRYQDYKTSIERLWLQAKQALRVAEKIVVIGYSFPETDIRAMGLLRLALSRRRRKIDLEIVAPDAEQIATRIGAEHLRKAKSVTLHSTRFDDYIRILSRRSPELMLSAAKKNVEVREWLKRILMLGQIAIRGANPK